MYEMSNEHNNAPAVPQAMAIVTNALHADPDYAWSWHCNVAMSALDEGLDHYRANKAAARFMSLLAGVDTSKHPGFPDATDATLKESINDRSERQFMERMASNHEMLTAFSQTIESFTHDYQLLYSTYKSYRDMLAGLIKERDSLRDQVAKPAQDVGLTDEVPAHVAGLLEHRRELDAIEFFESTNRDSHKFKKSVRGTYVNPAVARDWKWFQLGMKHATEDES